MTLFGLALVVPVVAPFISGSSASWHWTGRSWWVMGRTLGLALGTTAVAFLLGVSGAWALAHRNLPGRQLFKAWLLAPFLVPPYLLTMGWLRLCEILGVRPPHGTWAAVIVLGLCFYPLVLYPTLLALERVGGGQEEAGWMAVGTRATWRGVLWPLAAPFAAVGAAAVWMLALLEYGVPALLGVNTHALEIFALIQGYHDYAAASWASLPLLVLSLGPALGVLAFAANRPGQLFNARTSRPAERPMGEPLRYASALSLGLLGGVATVLPLGALASRANRLDLYSLALWEAGPDIVSSLWLAGAAAGLAMVLGGYLAWEELGNGWAPRLTLLTLGIPPALLALGLIATWNRPGPMGAVYSSGLLLVWGLAVRFLALSACLLAASRASLPPALEESTRFVPGPRWRPWLLSRFALHRRNWWVAFSLVFALCLGELSLTLLLVGPGTSTLSLRIFNLFHYGRHDLVGALSMVLVAIVLTPPVVAMCLEEPRR